MNVLKQIFVVVIKVLRNYEMVVQLPEECFALRGVASSDKVTDYNPEFF